MDQCRHQPPTCLPATALWGSKIAKQRETKTESIDRSIDFKGGAQFVWGATLQVGDGWGDRLWSSLAACVTGFVAGWTRGAGLLSASTMDGLASGRAGLRALWMDSRAREKSRGSQ